MLILHAVIIAMAFSMFNLINGHTYIQCSGGQHLWVLATPGGSGTAHSCSPLPCDRPENCTCNSACSSGPPACAHALKTVYCPGQKAIKAFPTTLPSLVYWRRGSPCLVTITPGDGKVAEVNCLHGNCRLNDAPQITPCSKAVKNGTFSFAFDTQNSDVLIGIEYLSATPTSSTAQTTSATTSQPTTTTIPIDSSTSSTISTPATISNPTGSLTTKPANATKATSLPYSTTSPILSSIFNIPGPSTPLTDSKNVSLEDRGNATLSPDVIAIVTTLSIIIVLTAVLIGLLSKFFYQKSLEKKWDSQLIISPRSR